MSYFKYLLKKTKIRKSPESPPAIPPVVSESSQQQIAILPSKDAQQETKAKIQSNTCDKTEELGLRLIHIPNSVSDDDEDEDRARNSLDIVAVHGITGNAYSTWTHDNGTFWLKDLIPKNLPGVRVFSYGYPADVFCTFATGTIDTFARSLLESLKRERRGKDVCPLFI